MLLLHDLPRYVFVVDTRSPPGNFERELCGYVTGVVGPEDDTGCEQADRLREDFPEYVDAFAQIVQSVPDEHGCHRPASSWPTPGWFNNGLGGCFQEGQETEALAHFRAYCLREIEKSGTYAGLSTNDQHRAVWRRRAALPLTKHPIFQSVAIFLNERPSDEMLVLMMRRTREFCAHPQAYGFCGSISITGFRLLTLSLVEHEQPLPSDAP